MFYKQNYVPLEEQRESNVVQTAWAMMGLIQTGQVTLNLYLN